MCEEGFSSVIYFIIINIMLFLFWFMLFLKQNAPDEIFTA